jgi:hypothetical protein
VDLLVVITQIINWFRFYQENLNLVSTEESPINTINFAKNFNNLVLSQGTFSWWIAFLSKAKIYFIQRW